MDSFKLTKKYLIATILQQWMDELIFAEARCVQQLKKKILNIEKFQKGHRKIQRKKKKEKGKCNGMLRHSLATLEGE